MTASAKGTPHKAVKQQLETVGISKALIIDDAFDKPTRQAVSNELPDFWAKIEFDDAAMAELHAIDSAIANESDISDEVLQSLWDKRKTDGHLADAVRTLFSLKIGDWEQLEKLSAFLVSLQIQPVRLGSDEDEPHEQFKLIFIDYYLGGVGENAVEHSRGRARHLYDSAVGERPFIVLMSSADVGSPDLFRESSGLVRGLFGWLPKGEFSKADSLYLHFATWAFALPTRHEIQQFVETLEDALTKVSEEFKKYVRSLGFEDYANIQAFCLQEEGQPLGEYMLWLYKSLLGHLLHSQPPVKELQAKLDAMEFSAFMPNQWQPSLRLAEIYGFAVTEPNIGPLGPHPRHKAAPTVSKAHEDARGDSGSSISPPDAARGEAGPALLGQRLDALDEPLKAAAVGELAKSTECRKSTFTPMFVTLGDLFIKEHGRDVRAVINGACDLSFAPNEDREVHADLSVLLLHGRLELYEETSPSPENLRTELLKHDGHAYRIVWSRDRVTSVPFRDLERWCKEEKFERKARLSLPAALQIQQAFAMATMRVGMPVRPPVYRRVPVAVHGMDATGNYKSFCSVEKGAVVINRRRDNKPDDVRFVLTLECVLKIIGQLDEVEQGLVERKASLDARAEAEKGRIAAERDAAPAVEEGARAGTGDPKTSKGPTPEQKAVTAGKESVRKALLALNKLRDANLMWEGTMHRPMQLPSDSKPAHLGDGGPLVSVYKGVLEGEFTASDPVVLALILEHSAVAGFE